ncbi:MAG: hypothetical protein M3O22_02550 [Pseudomonadota bacterium]|nr:hypothetical protein [Pseudomonadota bacterium]
MAFSVAGYALIENRDGDWLVMMDVAGDDPTTADLRRMAISGGSLVLDFDAPGKSWQARLDIRSKTGQGLARFLHNGSGLLVYAANGQQKVMFGPHPLGEIAPERVSQAECI